VRVSPLEQFIPRYLSDRALPNLAPLISAELERGRVLFLFDGMDEVLTADERHEIAREIQTLAARYPACRVVVTSRLAGYEAAPLAGDFAHVTIAEFGMEKEVPLFAKQWSTAFERIGMPPAAPLSPEAQARADQRAANLLHAIRGNPGVERLAKNPLLLTILALIHHQGTRLPQRRVELYRLSVEALAETWNLARTPERPIELWLGDRRLDERQVVRILAPIAFWMHEQRPAGLITREELAARIARHFEEQEGKAPGEAQKLADDFIHLMQQVAGLIVERGLGQFGFLHLTFQEYLAARYLAERGRDRRWELIRPHLYAARWREVILLTAGILFEEDATEFVRAILETPGEYDDLLHRNLFLAARCLADDVPVDYQLRRRIVDELKQVWRTARFEKLREETTNALASLNGTASQFLATEALLAALRDEHAGVRWRAAEALGQLGVASEAVVTALLATLRHEDAGVRSGAAEALRELGVGSKAVVEALLAALRDKHADVRGAAAHALGKLAPPDNYVAETLRRMCKARTKKERYVGVSGRFMTVKDFAFEALWAIVDKLDSAGSVSPDRPELGVQPATRGKVP